VFDEEEYRYTVQEIGNFDTNSALNIPSENMGHPLLDDELLLLKVHFMSSPLFIDRQNSS
jgi:hypothetical protein